MTMMSSRTFNQDTAKAKRSTTEGPVFITDRGVPAYVLLSIAEYRRLSGKGKTLSEALAMPPDDVFEFEFEENKTPRKPFDFD